MVSFEELLKCDGVKFTTNRTSGLIVVNTEENRVYFLSDDEDLRGSSYKLPNDDLKGYSGSWICSSQTSIDTYTTLPQFEGFKILKAKKLIRI